MADLGRGEGGISGTIEMSDGKGEAQVQRSFEKLWFIGWLVEVSKNIIFVRRMLDSG